MRRLLLILLLLATSGYAFYCYQESANSTSDCSGTCTCYSTGGYATEGSWTNGANVYDGNWGTSGYGSSSGSYIYVNYTKPSWAKNDSLISRQLCGATRTNSSIPASCWSYNSTSLQLRLYSYAGTTYRATGLYCNNGTWVEICFYNSTATASRNVIEEGVYWNISIDSWVNVNMTSPVNTTYTNTVPFSINCSGSDSSYLANITIDGVVNVSNQAVNNNTLFSTNITHTAGTHNTTMTCTNTSTNTSSALFYTVYGPPSVVLSVPYNNTGNFSSIIPFGYSAISTNDAALSCSIYINGTLNQTNASYANATTGQFLITGFQNGTYPWFVRCTGSLGNYGESETRMFIVAYDSGGGGGSVLEGQATEFVAASVTMVGLLWFFVYLMNQAKGWLWKTVWLAACFLCATMALAMMRLGFSNILADTDMTDLAFSSMMIMMYCVILVFAWLIFQLVMFGFNAINDAVKGKKMEDDMGKGM